MNHITMQALGPLLAARTGQPAHSFVEVVDMAPVGVPRWGSRAFQAARLFTSIAKTVDSNYPERLRKICKKICTRFFDASLPTLRTIEN